MFNIMLAKLQIIQLFWDCVLIVFLKKSHKKNTLRFFFTVTFSKDANR